MSLHIEIIDAESWREKWARGSWTAEKAAVRAEGGRARLAREEAATRRSREIAESAAMTERLSRAATEMRSTGGAYPNAPALRVLPGGRNTAARGEVSRPTGTADPHGWAKAYDRIRSRRASR